MSTKAINLDAMMTPAEFARFLGVTEYWLRKRLAKMPGVCRESRKVIRIHPRTYIERRAA